jgi:hypothetical protein
VTKHLTKPTPPIAPVVPLPSILTTARPLPGDIDWSSGISFRPRRIAGDADSITIDDITGEEDCPTPSELDAEPLPDEEHFVPQLARVPWQCEQVFPGQEDRFRAEARDELEAATAYHLSAALGADLAAHDSDVSADGAIHPLTALSILLANYASCTQSGGGAIVHVPAVLIPTLLASGAVKQSGDVYLGPLGSVVSPGPGYSWANEDDVVLGTMYVSGPVEYALGAIVVRPEGNAAMYDRRANLFRVEAQRAFIFRYDRQCVFSASAFLPSPASGEGAL